MAISLGTIPWMTIQDSLCQGFTYEFPPPYLSTLKVNSKEKCSGYGYRIVCEQQCQNQPRSFKVSFLTSILVPLNLSSEILLPPTSYVMYPTLLFRNCLPTILPQTIAVPFIFSLCLFSILSYRKLILMLGVTQQKNTLAASAKSPAPLNVYLETSIAYFICPGKFVLLSIKVEPLTHLLEL